MSEIVFLLTLLITAFLLALFIMPYGIRLLIKYKIWKNIRSEWLIGKAKEFAKIHSKKSWTPTMGGIIMIFCVILLIFLSIIVSQNADFFKSVFGFKFNNSLWNRQETFLAITTLIGVGIVGAIDDYFNVKWIWRTKWLSARLKTILLSIIACIWAFWFFVKLWHNSIHLPFFGNLETGFLYIPIFIFVFLAAANSVNITDWLDWLAGGLLLFQYLAYWAITYFKWMFILSGFCFIISGILIAFLWFNTYPAKVFMWDTGSLALWATLAIIAFMTNTIIAFIIMSSIFIFETISVILQLASKKFRNWKKIFRIAPFHHHLEAIGWEEQTIVIRLWLLGIVLAIIGVLLSFSRII